jgi:cell division protein FtsN
LETAAPPPAPALQSASDIDSLLNQLADAGPATAPPAPLAAPSTAVQAGAYSSRANAERAAAALEGQTQIVPVEQSGRTLYKVMLAQ